MFTSGFTKQPGSLQTLAISFAIQSNILFLRTFSVDTRYVLFIFFCTKISCHFGSCCCWWYKNFVSCFARDFSFTLPLTVLSKNDEFRLMAQMSAENRLQCHCCYSCYFVLLVVLLSWWWVMKFICDMMINSFLFWDAENLSKKKYKICMDVLSAFVVMFKKGGKIEKKKTLENCWQLCGVASVMAMWSMVYICHFHKKVMLRRNEMSTHVINDILTCLASVLISFEKTPGWQCERIQMVIPHVQWRVKICAQVKCTEGLIMKISVG